MGISQNGRFITEWKHGNWGRMGSEEWGHHEDIIFTENCYR